MFHKGDLVPLEDCEEGEKPITYTILVGKILCVNALNKAAVKMVMSKA